VRIDKSFSKNKDHGSFLDAKTEASDGDLNSISQAQKLQKTANCVSMSKHSTTRMPVEEAEKLLSLSAFSCHLTQGKLKSANSTH